MDTSHGTTVWDSVVIGASAAGLSAALMLGRAARRTLVFDSGLPRNRFAQHMHGVLGHEGKAPQDLTNTGRAECEQYGIEFTDAAVTAVESSEDHLLVWAGESTPLRSRTVILATGIVDNLPPIAGIEDRWGTVVLHCPYCHGWEVKGRKLGVLATSPGSIHQAKLIRQWSNNITFYSALGGELDPAQHADLEARGIHVEPRGIESVSGDTVGARLNVALHGGSVEQVDALFTAPEPLPNDSILVGLGLVRSAETGLLEVSPAGQSSNPRVWAAGNVVNPYANVPMAMGTGSFTGASVNGWLTEDDFTRGAY